MSTFSYDDLRIPGAEFSIKATSILDEDTEKMLAIFEVEGGKGRITIEYDADMKSTIQTDYLATHMQAALLALTARMAEEVMFRQITESLETELGGGDAA